MPSIYAHRFVSFICFHKAYLILEGFSFIRNFDAVPVEKWNKKKIHDIYGIKQVE